MKKLFLAFLILCVWTSVAFGGMVIQKISSGGGPDTYYYSNDPLESTTKDVNNDSGVDMQVTATQAGSITKVGCNISDTNTSNNIAITLYTWDGDSWEKHENKHIETAANGWVDATLTTPYAVSNAEDVMVVFVGDGNTVFYCTSPATVGGYTNAFGYGDVFAQTYNQTATYRDWDVRIYVD